MGLMYGLPNSNRLFKASATSTFPIICNGNPTYAGAPARDEDPRYPLENLLSADRYAVWATAIPSAGSTTIHVDLSGGSISAGAGGADKTLNAFGLLNLRANAGSLPPHPRAGLLRHRLHVTGQPQYGAGARQHHAAVAGQRTLPVHLVWLLCQRRLQRGAAVRGAAG
jgi:hypothetical protein